MSLPKKQVLYIALELTADSQNKLKEWFSEQMLNIQATRTNWNEYTTYCHHMTIAFYTEMTQKTYTWCVSHDAEKFKITAKELGISDKAIAVKVDTLCLSENDLKHVTLATNKETKGKPVDSNYITEWQNIEPFELEGVVTFYKKYEQEETPTYDHENFRYIGLNFEMNDAITLKNIALDYIKRLGWKHYKLTAHHITIANKNEASKKILKWADLHAGKEEEFKIIKIGWTDKVIALQIDAIFPSAYDIKHLTLAINTDHKEARSGHARDITNWQDFGNFTMKGIVNYIRD